LLDALEHESSEFDDVSKENEMPFINVKVIEGVFSDSQKEAIVKDLAEAMIRIEGENMRPVTWVVVEEVRSGSWSVGGNPLTTEAVKALAAGTAVSA
jgi:4-oxalocrotonate tautomerase